MKIQEKRGTGRRQVTERRIKETTSIRTFYPLLIGGNGGTLNTDVELLDGIGTVYCHLVIGGVSVLNTKVVGVQLNVEEGQDQLFLDQVPNNTGHLIPQHLHHRAA